MLAGPLQRIQFWVCLLIQSWLTLVGSNSLELEIFLATQFFRKELSLKMSASEKVCIYLYLELKNYSFFVCAFVTYRQSKTVFSRLWFQRRRALATRPLKIQQKMRKVKNHFFYNEKIFYCFKLFTEPEPSKNSLSSLLSFLRVHFACVITTFALNLAHIRWAKLMVIPFYTCHNLVALEVNPLSWKSKANLSTR